MKRDPRAVLDLVLDLAVDQNTNHVYKRVLVAALEATASANGTLYEWDPGAHLSYLRAIVGADERPDILALKPEQGIMGEVVRTGEPLLVGNVVAHSSYICLSNAKPMGSQLSVPLKVRGKLIGVINVEAEGLEAFDKEDQDLLLTLAGPAVAKIRYARLLAALGDAAELVASGASLVDVYELLLNKALELTGCNQGTIYEWNARVQMCVLRAIAGAKRMPYMEQIEPTRGIMGHAVRTQKSIRVPDLQDSDDYISIGPDMASQLSVPLLSRKKLFGVINLESEHLDFFDDSDQRLIETFCRIATAKITDAQLTTTFRDLAEAVAGEKPPEFIYELLLERALATTGSACGTVYEWNRRTRTSRLRSVRGAESSSTAEEVRWDEGLMRRVIETESLLNIGDVTQYKEYIGLRPGIMSQLSVPLRFDDALTGVINIESEERDGFNERDEHVLTTLSDLASIALARLKAAERLGAERTRADAMELMASIGQSATEISHRVINDLGLIPTLVKRIRRALQPVHGTPPSVESALDKIVRDSGAALKMAARLKEELAGGGSERTPPVRISAADLWDQAIAATTVPANVRISRGYPEEELFVWASPTQIFAVFLNLLANAVQELTPGGGHVALTAADADEFVRLVIEDSGKGISPDEAERVWRLLYSTREGGMGFGLWSARSTVLASGGKISLGAAQSGGARFEVLLPKPPPGEHDDG